MTFDVFKEKFLTILHKEMALATAVEVHNALAGATLEYIDSNWEQSSKKHLAAKRACYFSAEFLVGRAIYNNLLCLGILEDTKAFLAQYGYDIESLEEIEDMALGNGGLGRLAACFLDSAATLNLPLDGYGIRYKFGLFKQSIVDGEQVEAPDDWTAFGDPWSVRVDSDKVAVTFADQTVTAVPYDMPIIGYKTDNVGTLRLWQSEANDTTNTAPASHTPDEISNVLYPNDDTELGKILRLKQQYFFCCASLTDIIRIYKAVHGSDFSKFADFYTIQLNDTHPVISIPELIRQLTELEGVSFDNAFKIAQKTFNYTNHTIMAEALEKWSKNLMVKVVPNIYKIIVRINHRFVREMQRNKMPFKEIDHMRIVDKCTVHMARLAIYASSYTNGVAELHTDILKNTALPEWYKLYPERFQNKTNGITQRRWLALCNKEMSSFITELLGSDAWITNLDELKKLEVKVDDVGVLDRFIEIKQIKKTQLTAFVKLDDDVDIDARTIFDIQIKRLHEYKRQFMNALSILYIYYGIKDGSIKNFTPTTFIFGAKSAPSYARAKGIIKMINEIADLIAADKEVCNLIKVLFVQNYNVSYAEKLVSAADVSEQISTAGTEASGTGNMKFMLNGTVTLGTFDGANVEIVEEAGEENNYIFGARVLDIEKIKDSYNPTEIYESDEKIKRVLDCLIDGTLNDGGTGIFKELHSAILKGASWHKPDHYYVLLDLLSYVDAKLLVNRDYCDTKAFARKCFINMANAGKFSSDRTIADYAQNIWKIK